MGDGGAENTLYKICKSDKKNQHFVISLKKSAKYSSMLQKINTKVHHLNMNFFSIFGFFSLIKIIRTTKPNIVQTWLVHGDLIGGIAAKLSGIKNIIWNVRYSNLEIQKGNLINLFLIKILAKLSNYIPRYIIVVSKSTKKNCKDLGYNQKKLFLIPNGYDISELKPIKGFKSYLRKKFKIKKKIPILGNVARYDPMKDHRNLVNALSRVKKKNINFFCILTGSNIEKKNKILFKHIKEHKLENHINLLGRQKNITKIMNAIDIYIQSSRYGEGFPNVIAEAMACETPCVTTNVGDAAFIVKKNGSVVAPNNSYMLSKAIIKNIFYWNNRKFWKRRCKKSRVRIVENFNLNKMIKSYNNLWNML